MCGIFGSFRFDGGRPSAQQMQDMAEAIAHRGPDFADYRVEDSAALGNTRLSIIDLTSASNQPFLSEDGQTVVVQNGEIYNFIELREELIRLGARFRTSGDTEVILRAYQIWGRDFVEKLNGMFAIAILDKRDNRLWLYRDRLGVKPLYLSGSVEGGRIWFASEIKAILAVEGEVQPDYDALAQFLALNYIPPPATAFAGIRHLPAAHIAEISPKGISLHRYWDLADIQPDPQITKAEAKAGILSVLDDATRIRMRADAPFGAFLSGGLDSSTVVGLMSMHQSTPVRTYSIGFDNDRLDETRFALMAATRFGTVHKSEVMRHDATDNWARFIWHVDQPHGDVSFMPTDQVARLAAHDVKMVLTGDGGDELFAGYDKYISVFPRGEVELLEPGWEAKFVRQAGLLQAGQPEQLLKGELGQAFRNNDPYRAMAGRIEQATHQDPINRVLLEETNTLLPGNNLVKPDRMGMANSLEIRSPFLDYRLAEFAFKIPGRMKLEQGQTKAIYKEAVRDLLGDELTYRKKQMFTVPVGDWFRGPLIEFCRELLLDGRLAARGLVQQDAVASMLEAHIAGRSNYTRQIRAFISLEIWFRLFIDRDPDWLEQAKNGSR